MVNNSQEFNMLCCVGYKKVLYQIGGDFRLLDAIEQELGESHCSSSLNNWLIDNHEKLVLFPDQYNVKMEVVRVSDSLQFWVSVLESYLRSRHYGDFDTPSPKNLWDWAVKGHLEYGAEARFLESWGVRLEGKVLYFGESGETNYRAYRQFFLRNIGLKACLSRL